MRLLSKKSALRYGKMLMLTQDMIKIIQLVKNNYFTLLTRVEELKIVTEKICLERINKIEV